MSTEFTIAGIFAGAGAVAAGFWKAVSFGKELDRKVNKDVCKIFTAQHKDDMMEVKNALKENQKMQGEISKTLNEIKISIAKMNGG